MDFSTFRADTEKENGVWIEYGDARILIASANAAAYKKALRKKVAKIPQHLIRTQPKIAEKAAADVMAEHILLNWEGLTDGGQPVEATPENRRKYLDIPAFADWVSEQAMNLANFQTEDEAADVAALKSDDSVGTELGD